ncbi:MAG: ABC transporter permease [Oscillospiraceae bacterium]|nr:ABC transporter permease [Oscillospiraceae bacterium]
MIKLLRGEFIRLFKSVIFWLGAIFMFVYSLLCVYIKWSDGALNYYLGSNLLFEGTMFIGIVIAVFIGIFIGSDYKDGTIRNKFIVGHTRISIYLSNLIICIAASLMIHIIWLAVILSAEKIGLTPKSDTTDIKILTFMLISFVSVAAFDAIFLLICMLITSNMASSVTVLGLSFLMLMVTPMIDIELHQPEYYKGYSYMVTDSDGNTYEEYQQGEKNAGYVDGVQRKFYKFIYDFLPQGQITQLRDEVSGAATEDWQADKAEFPLYSLSLIVVTTATGVLLFRRKDLK